MCFKLYRCSSGDIKLLVATLLNVTSDGFPFENVDMFMGLDMGDFTLGKCVPLSVSSFGFFTLTLSRTAFFMPGLMGDMSPATAALLFLYFMNMGCCMGPLSNA